MLKFQYSDCWFCWSSATQKTSTPCVQLNSFKLPHPSPLDGRITTPEGQKCSATLPQAPHPLNLVVVPAESSACFQQLIKVKPNALAIIWGGGSGAPRHHQPRYLHEQTVMSSVEHSLIDHICHLGVSKHLDVFMFSCCFSVGTVLAFTKRQLSACQWKLDVLVLRWTAHDGFKIVDMLAEHLFEHGQHQQ